MNSTGEIAMKDQKRTGTAFASFCLALTIVFAAAMALSGFGTRQGWWDFRRGLAVLRWSAYAEAVMVLVSLAGCVIAGSRKSKNGLVSSVIAVVMGIISMMIPVRMWMIVRSVPPIHDITTDRENPPQFDAVLSARIGALNPAEYGGIELAEQQLRAYPDISPLRLGIPPQKAFERSLAAAKAKGWKIVAAEAYKGVIEATDTSLWFGFKDDIVIRITAEGNGSRIDMRSLSRVGKSDVGANARRIRNFQDTLRKSG
jgi:uncharacterized protein (DUF1499 family)